MVPSAARRMRHRCRWQPPAPLELRAPPARAKSIRCRSRTLDTSTLRATPVVQCMRVRLDRAARPSAPGVALRLLVREEACIRASVRLPAYLPGNVRDNTRGDG